MYNLLGRPLRPIFAKLQVWVHKEHYIVQYNAERGAGHMQHKIPPSTSQFHSLDTALHIAQQKRGTAFTDMQFRLPTLKLSTARNVGNCTAGPLFHGTWVFARHDFCSIERG